MPVHCQRCGHENTDGAKFCLNCGAMLEHVGGESEDPMIGRVLMDRYRLTQVIGEGGMGKVYRAEQKMGTTTRPVAIKTLHRELCGDPQLVARFHRECETVVDLHHPNTIDFYDFGDLDDGSLFIVMELVEGESLAHLLERGPLDYARVDRLLIQIVGSLHEAHQKGVVHRDLKPENVLLTNKGGQTDFVKVLDFGIAKRSEAEDDSQAKLTKQGMVLGTPPYMSPEQFSGQALDARSDIYSLGVMTYEMLTGKLPFEAKTPWEWATKHLTAEPTPIESHDTGRALSDSRKHALRRALAKDRDQRQATALDYLNEFTGHHDAQAAWTMATSGSRFGGMAQAPPPTTAQPRPAVGTPESMPQSGAYEATAGPAGSGAAEAGRFPTSQLQLPVASSLGKVVAVLAAAFIVVGGGGLAAIWWWSSGDEPVTEASETPDPPPAPTSSPAGGPSSPTTPRAEPPDPPPTPANQAGRAVPTTPSDPPRPRKATAPPAEKTRARKKGGNGPRKGRPAPRSAGTKRARDPARGQSLVQDATEALKRNNLDAAISSLGQAQTALGRGHASLGPVRTRLANKASNKIGILLQQGNCSGAQALYRRLRTVRAERSATVHFSDEWCRRP